AGVAVVSDPGAVRVTPPADAGGTYGALARVEGILVQADRDARLTVDSRTGLVVAGGDIVVGPASVSHAGITLTIGVGPAPEAMTPEVEVAGTGRAERGATVQEIAGALHAAGAQPRDIAQISQALHAVGALQATLEIQ